MDKIAIKQDSKIIAHHTTDNPMSHYGQPVWVIEDSNPACGMAVWTQGKNQFDLAIIGICGGWLVAAQPDGLLVGIIWSDGNYYADLIEDRASHQPISVDEEEGSGVTDLTVNIDDVIDKMLECGCQVRGTLAIDVFDNNSPLGSILT